ncbi:hypothetical protein SADUNF_Sadunf02G0103000 [Salix dunnii]|uniref:Uncharacterized protein n=1 Tax=Salix dunnii TaxID=1413687 RepID=A0A835N7E7_9ROSI|nr:hypothetical protein SADUNF_Sadunf02G0103000 [Salix dunnii]
MPTSFIGRKMHLQQSLRVFMLQELVVLILLVLFVSGDQKEETAAKEKFQMLQTLFTTAEPSLIGSSQEVVPLWPLGKSKINFVAELQNAKGDFHGHILDASITILLIRLHFDNDNDGDVRGSLES